MARPTLGEKAMSVAERTRSSRTARQQSGKRIDVMLGPDGTAALEELRQIGEHGNNTKDIVEAALIKEAKRSSSKRKKENL